MTIAVAAAGLAASPASATVIPGSQNQIFYQGDAGFTTSGYAPRNNSQITWTTHLTPYAGNGSQRACTAYIQTNGNWTGVGCLSEPADGHGYIQTNPISSSYGKVICYPGNPSAGFYYVAHCDWDV